MLLAIDISNTNIKFGMYSREKLQHHWVVSTVRQRTTDEYAMILHDLLKHAGYTLTDVDDIIISCVVPPFTWVMQLSSPSLPPQRLMLFQYKAISWVVRLPPVWLFRLRL